MSKQKAANLSCCMLTIHSLMTESQVSSRGQNLEQSSRSLPNASGRAIYSSCSPTTQINAQESDSNSKGKVIGALLQAGCFEALQTIALPSGAGSPPRLRAQVCVLACRGNIPARNWGEHRLFDWHACMHQWLCKHLELMFGYGATGFDPISLPGHSMKRSMSVLMLFMHQSLRIGAVICMLSRVPKPVQVSAEHRQPYSCCRLWDASQTSSSATQRHEISSSP